MALEKTTRIFLKKMKVFLRDVLSLAVVVLIRTIRPIMVVRFGRINLGRIGEFYHGDGYLIEKNMGLFGKKYYDVFYFISSTGHICNKQLLVMWKRVLPVSRFERVALCVDSLNRKWSGCAKHLIPDYHDIPYGTKRSDNENQDIATRLKHIISSTKPNISFTEEEEILGRKLIRELGVPDRTPFVCFHSRDAAYLNGIYPKRDWMYHDFRDSSIKNCIPAAEEMVKRGYFTVRMGAIVKEELSGSNPAIIDYSCSGKRNDFLDIYLGAKCRFFICSDSGISTIPEIFRRPTVYTNWTILNRISPWVINGLFIFKHFYLHTEERYLTFREIMNLDLGGLNTKAYLARLKIELIENTPEEITAAAIEMDERIRGTWETTTEDAELQQRFWSLFGPNKLKNQNLRIGAEFLRQNRHLLSELVEQLPRCRGRFRLLEKTADPNETDCRDGKTLSRFL